MSSVESLELSPLVFDVGSLNLNLDLPNDFNLDLDLLDLPDIEPEIHKKIKVNFSDL